MPQPHPSTLSPRQLNLLFLVLGFFSTLAQVLVTRTLLNRLGGNELMLGSVLAAWLASVGYGILTTRKTGESTAYPIFNAGAATISLAPLLLLSYMAASLIRNLFGLGHGEAASPPVMLLGPWLVLVPIALGVGVSFNLCIRLAGGNFGEALRRVYFWEAVGSAIAGVIAGGIFLDYFGTQATLSFILPLLVLVGILLILKAGWPSHEGWPVVLGLLVLTVGAVISLVAYEGWRWRGDWPGYYPVTEEETRYGMLTVNERGNERSLFQEAEPLLRSTDHRDADQAVTLLHLLHPAPRSMLVLGGPRLHIWQQAVTLRRLERLDHVQPNAELYRLETLLGPLPEHSGYSSLVDDPAHFVRNSAYGYDIILFNLPEPNTLETSRFYTVEFFRQLKKRINQRGVLLIGLDISTHPLATAQAEFLQSLRLSLGEAFPIVEVYPLAQTYLAASRNKLPLKREALISRLAELGINDGALTAQTLEQALDPDRIHLLEDQLSSMGFPPRNHDVQPIAPFYSIALYLGRFDTSLFNLAALSRKAAWFFPISLFLFSLSALIFWWRWRQSKAGALFSISGAGILGAGVEVILLCHYQILTGSLYQNLGMLIGATMAGLGLGAYAFQRWHPSAHLAKKALHRMLLVLLGLMLLLSLAIELHLETGLLWLDTLGFMFVLALIASLCGAVFQAATRLLHARSALPDDPFNRWLAEGEADVPTRQKMGAAALAYGVDLVAGSIAALVAGWMMTPLLGFSSSLLFFAALLIPALLLIPPRILE